MTGLQIMALNDTAFRQRMRLIGMEAQVRAALRRIAAEPVLLSEAHEGGLRVISPTRPRPLEAGLIPARPVGLRPSVARLPLNGTS